MVAGKLGALLNGSSGFEEISEMVVRPRPPGGRRDSALLALGLILHRVGRWAAMVDVVEEEWDEAFVGNFVCRTRRCLAATFTALRREVEGSGGRDVFGYLCSEEACRNTLEKLLVPPVVVTEDVGVRGGPKEFLKFLTWNISGMQVSAQAPGDGRWTLKDNMAAVEAEIVRWDPDVVALQECSDECGLSRLVPEEGGVSI